MSALTPEQLAECKQLFMALHGDAARVPLGVIEMYAHQQAKIDALVAERDAAIAKLDALEKQEPDHWKVTIPAHRRGIEKDVCVYWDFASPMLQQHIRVGDKVEPCYSQPVPASPAPITREGCNYLAMQGTVCNKCGVVHK